MSESMWYMPTLMNEDKIRNALNGKQVLIVGGTRGIGKEYILLDLFQTFIHFFFFCP
jgi:hypothetical protein